MTPLLLLLAIQAAAAADDALQFTVLDKGPGPDLRVETEQYRVAQNKKDGTTIVSIFAGERPSGGWGIGVDSVDKNGRGVCTVRYHVRRPRPGMIVTQALTYPSTAISIKTVCRSVKVDPPLPLRK